MLSCWQIWRLFGWKSPAGDCACLKHDAGDQWLGGVLSERYEETRNKPTPTACSSRNFSLACLSALHLSSPSSSSFLPSSSSELSNMSCWVSSSRTVTSLLTYHYMTIIAKKNLLFQKRIHGDILRHGFVSWVQFSHFFSHIIYSVTATRLGSLPVFVVCVLVKWSNVSPVRILRLMGTISICEMAVPTNLWKYCFTLWKVEFF